MWPAQEASDVWHGGFTVFKGLDGFRLQEWPQEAIDVWRGVAVGCRMKHAKSTCEGAGKGQTWMPLQGEVWRVLGLANGRSY